ncbi:hypothetical protein [Cellulomonas sp. SG140]|nr:hypothetical protein [Cellulomonas sp. SG140]
MSSSTSQPQDDDRPQPPVVEGTGPDENELDPGKTSAEDSEDGGRSDAG